MTVSAFKVASKRTETKHDAEDHAITLCYLQLLSLANPTSSSRLSKRTTINESKTWITLLSSTNGLLFLYMIEWPHHWQSHDGGIRCIVMGCNFITDGPSHRDQAADLLKHCEDQCGLEHDVLIHMLRQNWCVHSGCSYNPSRCETSQIRYLFHHEKSTHNGATSMSRVETFVTLVRQGDVKLTKLYDVKMAIFDRMVHKIYLMGNAIFLIYRMGGCLDPRDQTLENLRKILASQALGPIEYRTPYWEPMPSHLFLTNIPPEVNAPDNDLWRIVWTRLRLMYDGGWI